MGETSILVCPTELHAFIVRCTEAVGTTSTHAHCLADNLTAADKRGHMSHGLSRLALYIGDIESGKIPSTGSPEILKETEATALVDGNNLLGPIVGTYCMELAIKKAKSAGVGFVTARGSNHFGIAGWYSMMALQHGMLGMAMTNTSPRMVPTRARQKKLGTNPLSLAAPGVGGDSIVLDMATTVVAYGKVQQARLKGQRMPLGWAVDGDGQDTTDPRLEAGIHPLGGREDTSGYKGFGLGMMVDILCGILSGGNYGPHVPDWQMSQEKQTPANWGQCFVAIDPNAFAPGFESRMSDLIDFCRDLEPAEGEENVMVPGDPEIKHVRMCDNLGGIPFHKENIAKAESLAKRLGVSPLRTKGEI